MTVYREDDRIDYAAREKYAKMSPEERDALLEKLEAEVRERLKK